MPTTASDTTSASADELRSRLADRLRDNGTVRTPTIEAALRQVPRDLFLPDRPLPAAYADEAVYTKHDSDGARISAASQPTIVATMLEQLQAEPGNRVLEIGTGTGYNAALLAALAGTAGHVTTIDVDEDLTDAARRHLAAAGVTTVNVVQADGALGHPAAAPFDRIVATVGAFEIPAAWLQQLAPAGRLVVPVRLAGAASRSLILERGPHGWVSPGSEVAVFMPLRGIGDDARRVIDLTDSGDVALQTHQDNTHATNPAALAGILDTARTEVWTSVHFLPRESFEWLYLWLACRLPNPIMRMEVATTAKDSGLVTPLFPTVTMATTAVDGSLAYLTIRPAEPDPDTDGRRYEIGVVGHGATGQQLADQVGAELVLWDQSFRTRTVRITIPDVPTPAAPDAGHFVLDRAHHPIAVTWE